MIYQVKCELCNKVLDVVKDPIKGQSACRALKITKNRCKGERDACL